MCELGVLAGSGVLASIHNFDQAFPPYPIPPRRPGGSGRVHASQARSSPPPVREAASDPSIVPPSPERPHPELTVYPRVCKLVSGRCVRCGSLFSMEGDLPVSSEQSHLEDDADVLCWVCRVSVPRLVPGIGEVHDISRENVSVPIPLSDHESARLWFPNVGSELGGRWLSVPILFVVAQLGRYGVDLCSRVYASMGLRSVSRGKSPMNSEVRCFYQDLEPGLSAMYRKLPAVFFDAGARGGLLEVDEGELRMCETDARDAFGRLVVQEDDDPTSLYYTSTVSDVVDGDVVGHVHLYFLAAFVGYLCQHAPFFRSEDWTYPAIRWPDQPPAGQAVGGASVDAGPIPLPVRAFLRRDISDVPFAMSAAFPDVNPTGGGDPFGRVGEGGWLLVVRNFRRHCWVVVSFVERARGYLLGDDSQSESDEGGEEGVPRYLCRFARPRLIALLAFEVMCRDVMSRVGDTLRHDFHFRTPAELEEHVCPGGDGLIDEERVRAILDVLRGKFMTIPWQEWNAHLAKKHSFAAADAVGDGHVFATISPTMPIRRASVVLSRLTNSAPFEVEFTQNFIVACIESLLEELSVEYDAGRWEIGTRMGKLHLHAILRLLGMSGEQDLFRLLARWQAGLVAGAVLGHAPPSPECEASGDSPLCPPASLNSRERGADCPAPTSPSRASAPSGPPVVPSSSGSGSGSNRRPGIVEPDPDSDCDFDGGVPANSSSLPSSSLPPSSDAVNGAPVFDPPLADIHMCYGDVLAAYRGGAISEADLRVMVSEGDEARESIVGLADRFVSCCAPVDGDGNPIELRLGWRRREFAHPTGKADAAVVRDTPGGVDLAQLKALQKHVCVRSGPRSCPPDCDRTHELRDGTRLRYFEYGGLLHVEVEYERNDPGLNRHNERLLVGSRVPTDFCVVVQAGGVVRYVFKYSFKQSEMTLRLWREQLSGLKMLQYIRDVAYDAESDDPDEARAKVRRVFYRLGLEISGKFGQWYHQNENLMRLKSRAHASVTGKVVGDRRRVGYFVPGPGITVRKYHVPSILAELDIIRGRPNLDADRQVFSRVGGVKIGLFHACRVAALIRIGTHTANEAVRRALVDDFVGSERWCLFDTLRVMVKTERGFDVKLVSGGGSAVIPHLSWGMPFPRVDVASLREIVAYCRMHCAVYIPYSGHFDSLFPVALPAAGRVRCVLDAELSREYQKAVLIRLGGWLHSDWGDAAAVNMKIVHLRRLVCLALWRYFPSGPRLPPSSRVPLFLFVRDGSTREQSSRYNYLLFLESRVGGGGGSCELPPFQRRDPESIGSAAAPSVSGESMRHGEERDAVGVNRERADGYVGRGSLGVEAEGIPDIHRRFWGGANLPEFGGCLRVSACLEPARWSEFCVHTNTAVAEESKEFGADDPGVNVLTPQQSYCPSMVVDALLGNEPRLVGRGILLSGPAGAGKTLVLRKTFKLIRELGKVVVATAATNFAAAALFGRCVDWAAALLFKWQDELLDADGGVLLETPAALDERFDEYATRVEERFAVSGLCIADCVAVDEAYAWDMTKLAVFDAHCRLVPLPGHSLEEPFGGRLILMSGDGTQLSPFVDANSFAELDTSIARQARFVERGCIRVLLGTSSVRRRHAVWLYTHNFDAILLTEVHRQLDSAHSAALCDLAGGNATTATVDLLMACQLSEHRRRALVDARASVGTGPGLLAGDREEAVRQQVDAAMGRFRLYPPAQAADGLPVRGRTYHACYSRAAVERVTCEVLSGTSLPWFLLQPRVVGDAPRAEARRWVGLSVYSPGGPARFNVTINDGAANLVKGTDATLLWLVYLDGREPPLHADYMVLEVPSYRGPGFAFTLQEVTGLTAFLPAGATCDFSKLVCVSHGPGNYRNRGVLVAGEHVCPVRMAIADTIINFQGATIRMPDTLWVHVCNEFTCGLTYVASSRPEDVKYQLAIDEIDPSFLLPPVGSVLAARYRTRRFNQALLRVRSERFLEEYGDCPMRVAFVADFTRGDETPLAYHRRVVQPAEVERASVSSARRSDVGAGSRLPSGPPGQGEVLSGCSRFDAALCFFVDAGVLADDFPAGDHPELSSLSLVERAVALYLARARSGGPLAGSDELRVGFTELRRKVYSDGLLRRGLPSLGLSASVVMLLLDLFAGDRGAQRLRCQYVHKVVVTCESCGPRECEYRHRYFVLGYQRSFQVLPTVQGLVSVQLGRWAGDACNSCQEDRVCSEPPAQVVVVLMAPRVGRSSVCRAMVVVGDSASGDHPTLQLPGGVYGLRFVLSSVCMKQYFHCDVRGWRDSCGLLCDLVDVLRDASLPGSVLIYAIRV